MEVTRSANCIGKEYQVNPEKDEKKKKKKRKKDLYNFLWTSF